jgi:hypothetical protein
MQSCALVIRALSKVLVYEVVSCTVVVSRVLHTVIVSCTVLSADKIK